ncbi:kinase RLK-Pelle-LRR-I-1 family protein [Tanacetum coccineum]
MALVHDLILPMSELRLATNNFSEENLLKRTPSVVLYKGQLMTDQSGQSIPIVVRRYSNPHVSFKEGRISLFHIHKNIATLFKVASEELADDDHDFRNLDEDTQLKVVSKGYLIYKYEVNQSLDKHLSGSTLTWMQRLHICLDLARALCYIHNELPDGDIIIHGNIKSSKILLNQNWEPTLHDPAYEKTKALTHKSDVYSFGVVLFEVLLGRVASIPISNEDNWSFARFALRTMNGTHSVISSIPLYDNKWLRSPLQEKVEQVTIVSRATIVARETPLNDKNSSYVAQILIVFLVKVWPNFPGRHVARESFVKV